MGMPGASPCPLARSSAQRGLPNNFLLAAWGGLLWERPTVLFGVQVSGACGRVSAPPLLGCASVAKLLTLSVPGSQPL